MARISPEKQSRSQQKVHSGLAAGPRQSLVRIGKATLEELAKPRVLGTHLFWEKPLLYNIFHWGSCSSRNSRTIGKEPAFLFMSITLISFHLSLGQGRYQIFPGTFIPVENVFTPRVKRT